MNAKEKAIQEQRTNQAIRENYMGSAGKIGMIAKWMGSEIISETGGLYDVNYLPQSEEDTDGLPVAEDTYLSLEGYVFDGLSRGMHLEIRYINKESKLTVDYRGYRVYTEIAGDIAAFAPFPEWMDMIEKLYKIAVEKQKKKFADCEEEDVIEIKKQQATWLQKLRMRWGI